MQFDNIVKLPSDSFITGETKAFEYHLFREDGRTPLDLTGCTAEVKIARSMDKSNALLTKKGNISTVTPQDGIVKIVLRNVDTNDWEEGLYVTQLILHYGLGGVYKAEGLWYIVGGIK